VEKEWRRNGAETEKKGEKNEKHRKIILQNIPDDAMYFLKDDTQGDWYYTPATTEGVAH
jgi:hypothetical protein